MAIDQRSCPLSLKRTKGSARAPVGSSDGSGYVVRSRSNTGGTNDATGAYIWYMEAATKWAELHISGWENRCGSHPQQHHRVWFKFVDLVTTIGPARLRCTKFEVFDHFYKEIGFEKYINFFFLYFSFYKCLYFDFVHRFLEIGFNSFYTFLSLFLVWNVR